MKTLSKKSDIQNVLSSKNKFVFNDFIVIYRYNNLGFPRFLFIVSKKVSKKAVERNRAKRLLRELVRKYIKKLENLSVDIVFIARKTILTKKLQDIEPEFKEFLKKLTDDIKTNYKPYKVL